MGQRAKGYGQYAPPGSAAARAGDGLSLVTLRRDWKSCGFFRHSSVREMLRSGAWLRLGASRSGGGIAERVPPFRRVLSCAVPCALGFPCLSERDEWPTTPVFGVLGNPNTRVFRRSVLGNVPTRGEAFPWGYCVLRLHFLKPMLRSSSYLRSLVNSRVHWFNAVTFLPTALRYGTRTLFCSQGTV
jgi:hypothetical protein